MRRQFRWIANFRQQAVPSPGRDVPCFRHYLFPATTSTLTAMAAAAAGWDPPMERCISFPLTPWKISSPPPLPAVSFRISGITSQIPPTFYAGKISPPLLNCFLAYVASFREGF